MIIGSGVCRVIVFVRNRACIRDVSNYSDISRRMYGSGEWLCVYMSNAG